MKSGLSRSARTSVAMYGTNPGVGSRNLGGDCRAAIHERDHVLEIVTREDVIRATAVKRFELRGDEQRRCDDPHGVAGDRVHLGGFDRRGVPAIAEAEHGGVCRHDVNDHLGASPAAKRRTRRRVFSQSQRTQPLGKRGVLRVGRDVNDGIDVLGRSDAACGRVRQEEAGRAPAHEDEVVEHGAEQPDDSLEERTIRVNHAASP